MTDREALLAQLLAKRDTLTIDEYVKSLHVLMNKLAPESIANLVRIGNQFAAAIGAETRLAAIPLKDCEGFIGGDRKRRTITRLFSAAKTIGLIEKSPFKSNLLTLNEGTRLLGWSHTFLVAEIARQKVQPDGTRRVCGKKVFCYFRETLLNLKANVAATGDNGTYRLVRDGREICAFNRQQAVKESECLSLTLIDAEESPR
jgi:hypothetical protein